MGFGLWALGFGLWGLQIQMESAVGEGSEGIACRVYGVGVCVWVGVCGCVCVEFLANDARGFQYM